jgi:hypothetical protein
VGEILMIDADRNSRRIARDLEERVADLTVHAIPLNRGHDIQSVAYLPAGLDDRIGFFFWKEELVFRFECFSRSEALGALLRRKQPDGDISTLRALPRLGDQRISPLSA